MHLVALLKFKFMLHLPHCHSEFRREVPVCAHQRLYHTAAGADRPLPIPQLVILCCVVASAAAFPFPSAGLGLGGGVSAVRSAGTPVIPLTQTTSGYGPGAGLLPGGGVGSNVGFNRFNSFNPAFGSGFNRVGPLGHAGVGPGVFNTGLGLGVHRGLVGPSGPIGFAGGLGGVGLRRGAGLAGLNRFGQQGYLF